MAGERKKNVAVFVQIPPPTPYCAQLNPWKNGNGSDSPDLLIIQGFDCIHLSDLRMLNRYRKCKGRQGKIQVRLQHCTHPHITYSSPPSIKSPSTRFTTSAGGGFVSTPPSPEAGAASLDASLTSTSVLIRYIQPIVFHNSIEFVTNEQ